MPAANLLNKDGRINRPAVIQDARRQFRVMARHGWDWAECLRYSWLRARTMKRLHAANAVTDNTMTDGH